MSLTGEYIDPLLIDLDTSQPKRYNPNDEENVKNLDLITLQIQEVGQKYAVLVTPYVKFKDSVLLGHEAESYCKQCPHIILRFFCIDGEKRTRAIRDRLKLNTIRIERLYDLNIYQLLKIQFITCGKRIELNAADYADALVRWTEEYLKINPTKIKNDALVEIARLTGYSLSFVHGRELLNLPQLSPKVKQLVRENRLKVNAVIEWQRLKPEFRQIAEDYEVDMAERRKIGEVADVTPLRYRHIKHQQNRFEEKITTGKLTPEEEKDAMTDLIHSGGRTEGNRDPDYNFARYKTLFLSWYDRLSLVNLDGAPLKEMDNLSGFLTDLVTLFQNMQAQELKSSNLRKTKSALGNRGRYP